jgi:hypothetical protein
MKHSIEELLAVVYHHYPRGVPGDDPRYQQAEEWGRLSAARRAAGAGDDAWRAMLRRLDDRCPDCYAQNGSLHLHTGAIDACYSGSLTRRTPPPGERNHAVGFLVGFLVPYYVVYSDRLVEIDGVEKEGEGSPIWFDAATAYIGARFAGTPVVAGLTPAKREPTSGRRRNLSIVPSADDQAYWDAIVPEIEATFGCERMPPEVGRVVVPDVATNLRMLGQATLYDCLFSDQW